MGFKYSVSLLPAIQATGALALTLARLTLAEHASLGWTHDHTFNLLEFLRRKDEATIIATHEYHLTTFWNNYFFYAIMLPMKQFG